METCINYCERDGWAYMSSDEMNLSSIVQSRNTQNREQ